MLFIDEPLIAQVDSENGKTAVSIPTDHKLSKLTPSLSSNTEPPRYASHYDYSAAGDNEVFFIFYSYIFYNNLYIIYYTLYLLLLIITSLSIWVNKGSLTIYHNCIIVYKCAVVANLKNSFLFSVKKIGCL